MTVFLINDCRLVRDLAHGIVRRLYRASLLTTFAREITMYKLDSVRLQVRSDKDGTETAGSYTFFYGDGNENHELRTGFFARKRILPAVNWVEFVSDSLSCIILRGC
jgi:hypothetical protein